MVGVSLDYHTKIDLPSYEHENWKNFNLWEDPLYFSLMSSALQYPDAHLG